MNVIAVLEKNASQVHDPALRCRLEAAIKRLRRKPIGEGGKRSRCGSAPGGARRRGTRRDAGRRRG
jgi:hypothetical protein